MNSIMTERLEIRRFRQADKEQYAKIMTNPAVYKYLGSGEGCDEETARKMVTFFGSSLFCVGKGKMDHTNPEGC